MKNIVKQKNWIWKSEITNWSVLIFFLNVSIIKKEITVLVVDEYSSLKIFLKEKTESVLENLKKFGIILGVCFL